MIEFEGNTLYLNLLDTNAISEIVKNEESRTNYFNWSGKNNQLICFTPWSLLELRKDSRVYSTFQEIFSIVPCFMIKPYYHILKEEINNYPNIDHVDPIIFTFDPFNEKVERRLKYILNTLFTNSQILGSEFEWDNNWKTQVLNSILSLKSNFEPKNNYDSSDANRFVKKALPNYIHSQFPNKIVNDTIDPGPFKSVRLLLYVIFYRFYSENRNPEPQDIFDLMINAATPYMDSAIVEKFQAEIFKKIRNNSVLPATFDIRTLKDLRGKK